MTMVIYVYRMIDEVEKANEYLIYIHPDKRKKIMEDWIQNLILFGKKIIV